MVDYQIKRISKKNTIAGVLFVLMLTLFILVRLTYWSNVNEEPFSDMADYVTWGQHWATGDWMMSNQFWRAYKPPGVPLLYGAVFAFTGGSEIDNLRWVQLGISLVALTFFAWQTVRASGTMFAGLLLILVVTFTKSSVFWSYKVGTESLSEAFMYMSLGAALWVYRDSANRFKYMVLALVTVYATFVRPNSLPLVGVLVFFPLFKVIKADRKQALRCLVTYVIAAACIWAPWIGRNYVYCEQIVPLSTQGPYTFLWELGNVDLPGPDGKRMVVHVNQLQADAWKQFANDCEASQYAMGLVTLWLKENITNYPDLIRGRLLRYTTDRQIDLTHISRTQLNPILDPVLFDKTKTQMVFSTVAALTLSLFFVWVRIILVGLASTLLFSSLFLGDPRMIEPFIPLTIFMCLAPTIPFWRFVQRKYLKSLLKL